MSSIEFNKTKILKVKGDWQEVLNDCRSTVSKNPLNKEPSLSFKKRVLISEHSPIRDIIFKWFWQDIPSWCATHWVRHRWEKFVSTRREDRHGVPRNELSQAEPVNFLGEANVQHLIDTMRKRLCLQASKETREYAEDLKCEIHKIEPEIADVFVPNCIYRCGCPEKMGEPCEFFEGLVDLIGDDIKSIDIQTRYDAYNKWFYESESKDKCGNESKH